MKELSKKHLIDIYESHLEVIVTDDITKSQNKRRKKSGLEPKDFSGYIGLTSSPSKGISITLKNPEGITHNTIAHESFHTAHCIMDYIGYKFETENQEPPAYLCGHIAELVYKDLKKWKIKIK